MENEKSKAELLKEKLYLSSKSAYEVCDGDEIKKAYDYCEKYMNFLDRAKTERESVDEAVDMLKTAGFVPFEYGKNTLPATSFISTTEEKLCI